jgi:hypothetical protein
VAISQEKKGSMLSTLRSAKSETNAAVDAYRIRWVDSIINLVEDSPFHIYKRLKLELEKTAAELDMTLNFAKSVLALYENLIDGQLLRKGGLPSELQQQLISCILLERDAEIRLKNLHFRTKREGAKKTGDGAMSALVWEFLYENPDYVKASPDAIHAAMSEKYSNSRIPSVSTIKRVLKEKR